ncbi:kinesin-like protein KIN-7E [Nicotiana tabacum]|uniref:Kinesin-like protein n=5 Tax=Nicotiana tabacum TaxID=4097 RepID=A0A1S3ZFF4_TOBAC|nr:PREDICTED: kinesin-like protein NACK2 isoform X1 [Nicotiana tabacum]XP_016463215.1 PREDICTED: kinesin-like protein NACK2 isoform X1 [Nicotiana tabacum]XP_016463216.1 PREDICTED: kinesin-like protein NACK2 isoform X1 [Nicotiana tabacum]
MGAIGGEELKKWEKMQGAALGGEEKILVLVRLRPLSEKEIVRSEVSDWECINETTILYRNSLQERSGLPTAYTFDRVYRGDCSTREVYEGGTKDIALSVVSGINSTIFAYGQTSSGKTYTMNGITEFTVTDIYDYMQRHEERAFVLKFSAMEIYNEVVRDLLSSDSTPLRLLDDPEKGTIIEKLTEETLRDWDHLKELLSICEAQRQIGETYLNENSSRSHQILRLTIESSAREFIGKDNKTTLSASVNFVDLAGSERASQALSVGQRLKEGCHINRSLLTLGTVIRKLSKGRHGHVNYRDSKLTRILQPALGGNARTAIICTLSPARSHVEQSRNTLLFACCAKEVSTNAQVNVVMSDKALVKHLQKELARLESELKTPTTTCDHVSLLRKKDQQIEKLEKEVRELTKQRDLAQSRVEDLLRTIKSDKTSSQKDVSSLPSRSVKGNTYEDVSSVSCSSAIEESYIRDNESDATSCVVPAADQHQRGKESANVTGEDSDLCKEVRCIEMDESSENRNFESISLSNTVYGERMSMPPASSIRHSDIRQSSPMLLEQANNTSDRSLHAAWEQKMQDIQNTINSLVRPFPDDSSSPALSTSISCSRSQKLTRSRSCRANFMVGSLPPDFETVEDRETTPPNVLEKDFPGRPENFQRKHWKLPLLIYGANRPKLSRNNSQSSIGSAFVDGSNAPGDEDIPSVDNFVAGLKEMAKLEYDNQLHDQAQEAGKSKRSVKSVGVDPMLDSSEAPSDWPLEFGRLQKMIIELWQTCHISVIHRTYFFLLFKGDPMDSIYMEVEVRRLSFLKEILSSGNSAVQGGRTITLASSLKALRRERDMLSRLIYKRIPGAERNEIYQKWGINLNSKRRRHQLVHHLWSDTDLNRVIESAAVVAKLIGFSDQGPALKEMFGLSITPPRKSRRSFGWKNSMASLI